MQDTFPNVVIALRMYLVLMVTNCSAECSFSKLKLIENCLRTSMTQERLVNLAIMSTESDILREIGGVFLLRRSDLTDLARCVCRSFIRPSVSFLVF